MSFFCCSATSAPVQQSRQDAFAPQEEKSAYDGYKTPSSVPERDSSAPSRGIHRLLSSINHIEGFAVGLDSSLRIFYLSQNYKKIMGHLPEERLGHVGMDIVHPEDLQTMTHILEKSKNTLSYNTTARIRKLNNRGLYFLLQEHFFITNRESRESEATPHGERYQLDNVLIFSQRVKNIEPEIYLRRESLLRDSPFTSYKKGYQNDADRFLSCLQNVHALCFVTSLRGKIELATQGSQRVLGQPIENLIGTKLAALTYERDRPTLEAHLKKLRDQTNGVSASIPLRQYAQESLTDIRATLFEINTKSRKLLFIGALDSSREDQLMAEELFLARRNLHTLKLEQELAIVAARHEQTMTLLRYFTHETRNPLQGLGGSLDFLERDLAQLNTNPPSNVEQKIKESISHLRSSHKAIKRVVDEALDVQKLGEGKMQLEKTLCNPKELIRESIGMILGVREGEGVMEVSENLVCLTENLAALDFYCMIDGHRLSQVINNFLSNAKKFTQKGSITVGSRVSPSKDLIHLYVKDTGVGIEEENLAQLFDPFTQAKASVARKFGGTGLGLHICKKIMELMDGTIGVESRVEEGSTFWCEIPIHCVVRAESHEEKGPASLQKTPLKRPISPKAPLYFQNLRVLAVDDSSTNRLLLSRMLSTLTITHFELAKDGKEAVDKVKTSQPFDIVFMDVDMPVMGGRAATEIIHKEHPALPIIALTGEDREEDKQACLKSGMSEVVLKPYTLEDIRQQIFKWTHSARDVESDQNT